MALLEKFANIHLGPLPSPDQLVKLSPQDLKKIKARRDYDNELEQLDFVSHLECVMKEAEKHSSVFPISSFYSLLNKISSMESIALMAESGISEFCDVRLFTFRYFSKIKELNQLAFTLLTMQMENLTSDSKDIKFLNEASTVEITNGATKQALFEAWLNVLALTSDNEAICQQVLSIFLLEILDKIGEHGKKCLDGFLKLAKNSSKPSKLVAVCCMIKLLMKFKHIEYPGIYQDVFDTLGDVETLDLKPEISLQFLGSTEILLRSPYLATFMPAKLIRQMAMLAVQSSRVEVTSKILEILGNMKKIMPQCDAWTELQTDTDFKYKTKNEFKEGGTSCIHPELVTLRTHIEPDIVLDSGCILRGEVIESSGILVDFDGIDHSKVDCLHNKETRENEKTLMCFD
jgi:hypothetical protein